MKIQTSIFTILICFSAPILALPPVDTDGDSYPDIDDNCTLVANSYQEDYDSDGYGDRCDGDFNNDGIVDQSDEDYFLFMLNEPFGYFQEADFNSDGKIDAVDNSIFTSFKDLPPGPSQIGDIDRDGVFDSVDNCVFVRNAEQADIDFNGIGNACDDQDGDTVFDSVDNCIFVGNIDQSDTDNDGYGNICDGDLNNDGIVNSQDMSQLNDLIGTSESNADINSDGVVDATDQVLLTALLDAPPGPAVFGDIDYDGIYDTDDNCLTIENANQMDLDGDDLGANCDSDEFFVTVGKEVQINDYINQAQRSPAIAIDKNSNYVIAWEGRGLNSVYDDIYARLYDSSGEALGESFKVNTSDAGYQSGVSIDMDDNGNFIIVWRDTSSNVYAQRYSSLGERVGSEIQVSENSDQSRFGPAIAINESGGFWVVWDREGSADWEVYARRFNSNGLALGSEFKVNTSDRGYTPSVWQNGSAPAISYSSVNGYVIAWRSSNESRTRNQINLQRYSLNGEMAGEELLVDPSGDDAIGYPSIVHNNAGGFVVAWSGAGADDNDGIYARMFNEFGLPVGSEFTANTYRMGMQRQPVIALNGGGFVIVWQSFNQIDAWDVFAQRYSSTGDPINGEFQVNGYTSSWQDKPAVAMKDSGDFIVVWSDASKDGSSSGIFSQYFGHDTDKDMILNAFDNCIEISNSDQRDTNLDGFGNYCDADLNNDNITNSIDLGLFRQRYFTADTDADFNGDGIVNALDLGLFRQMYFKRPGPSGLVQ